MRRRALNRQRIVAQKCIEILKSGTRKGYTYSECMVSSSILISFLSSHRRAINVANLPKTNLNSSTSECLLQNLSINQKTYSYQILKNRNQKSSPQIQGQLDRTAWRIMMDTYGILNKLDFVELSELFVNLRAAQVALLQSSMKQRRGYFFLSEFC